MDTVLICITSPSGHCLVCYVTFSQMSDHFLQVCPDVTNNLTILHVDRPLKKTNNNKKKIQMREEKKNEQVCRVADEFYSREE